MDNLNQLAKQINTIKDTADYASKKVAHKKRIERATDTFDTKVPFEMEFRANPKSSTNLSLYFKPPAPSACCGTCYCSVCENFSNNITVTLTYGYISGTVNVFVDNIKVTDFVELDPDAGTLQLGTTGENIRICYIYFAGGCNPLDDDEDTVTCEDIFNLAAVFGFNDAHDVVGTISQDFIFRFKTNFIPGYTLEPDFWSYIQLSVSTGSSYDFNIGTVADPNVGGALIGAGINLDGDEQIDKTDWTTNTWHYVRIQEVNGGGRRLKVWTGSTQPSSWTLESSFGGTTITSININAEIDHNGGDDPVGTATINVEFLCTI